MTGKRIPSRDDNATTPPHLPSAEGRCISVSSLTELEKFAKRFAKTLRGGEVVALSGPLGAGKTTFVQFLGAALGVRERITSPTFTLMHVHRVGDRGSLVGGRKQLQLVAHIDAYRLPNARALVGIGALDYLGRPDTVTLVEWAEKVRRLLPKDTIWIIMRTAKDGKTRTMRLNRLNGGL